MEANQVEDADAADAAFRRHAQAMRGQVDALGAKNYGDAVEGSLDFVVMFVPGDQFLAAALSANPGLVEIRHVQTGCYSYSGLPYLYALGSS